MGAPLSPVGRVSFESVFKATAMEEGQTPKYGLTLLIPKKQKDAGQTALFKKMYKAANDLCKEKFGCGLDGKYKGKQIRSPFRCGSEKDHIDGYDDSIWFIRFSNRMKPNVVDQKKQPISEGEGFYSGCFAHVTYTLYSYVKINPGISFSLNNVQKVADGEPFGAMQTDPDDDFSEVGEVEEDEDITSLGD